MLEITNKFMAMSIKPLNLITAILFCSILLMANNSAFAIASVSPASHSTSSADSDYKKATQYEVGDRVKKDLKKAIRLYKKAANKSHPKAQYQLGIIYYQQKNYKLAQYWLKKRSIGGEPDAQYHYANILRYGLGTKQQPSSARKWYLKAAKQNHKQAQYELGLIYKKGIGAKRNLAKAEIWFKKAAKQNHKHAKQALKTLPKSITSTPKAKKQSFLKKNKKLAKAGNIEAQYKLGKAYISGKKAPKDPLKAEKWLKMAANADHVSAQFHLANIYFEGNGSIKKDIKKAKKWYSRAAENEHKEANKKLKKIARNDHKTRQLKYFDEMIDSALLGDTEQQYELGMRYLLGYKTDPDNLQAHYWLKLAATQNHPRAMYQLGNQYLQGIVVEKNTDIAIHYFAAAARQKVRPAETAIALFADNGYKNLIEAENGDKVAQLALAQTYMNKSDITDKKLGLKWLKKSANQSFVPALKALAKIYETGNITPKSYEKAFLTYKSAADLNDPSAQYQVGRMYQAGIGTPVNQQLAFRWLEKAASQGLVKAQQALQFSGL